MNKLLQSPVSRRILMIGGGAAGAAALGLAALFAPRHRTAFLGDIASGDIAPLGEGFFLADGWVLTEADLRAKGISPPAASKNDARAE